MPGKGVEVDGVKEPKFKGTDHLEGVEVKQTRSRAHALQVGLGVSFCSSSALKAHPQYSNASVSAAPPVGKIAGGRDRKCLVGS